MRVRVLPIWNKCPFRILTGSTRQETCNLLVRVPARQEDVLDVLPVRRGIRRQEHEGALDLGSNSARDTRERDDRSAERPGHHDDLRVGGGTTKRGRGRDSRPPNARVGRGLIYGGEQSWASVSLENGPGRSPQVHAASRSWPPRLDNLRQPRFASRPCFELGCLASDSSNSYFQYLRSKQWSESAAQKVAAHALAHMTARERMIAF